MEGSSSLKVVRVTFSKHEGKQAALIWRFKSKKEKKIFQQVEELWFILRRFIC